MTAPHGTPGDPNPDTGGNEIVSDYETATDLAAATIVLRAPLLARIAVDRKWVTDTGWVDLDRVARDAPEMEYLSGSEKRLLRTVVALHAADLWGLDHAHGAAAAEAFQAAADAFAADAVAARAAEERFDRAIAEREGRAAD